MSFGPNQKRLAHTTTTTTRSSSTALPGTCSCSSTSTLTTTAIPILVIVIGSTQTTAGFHIIVTTQVFFFIIGHLRSRINLAQIVSSNLILLLTTQFIRTLVFFSIIVIRKTLKIFHRVFLLLFLFLFFFLFLFLFLLLFLLLFLFLGFS